jgi:hypothetical protein
MSKVSEYQAALAEARTRLERISAKKAALAVEEGDLARAVQGWEAIISLERKTAGQESEADHTAAATPTQSTQETDGEKELALALLGLDEEEDGENKTQFVRDVIRKRSNVGTTPADLKKEAKAVGLKHPPSWPYGPIQRLKKKGEIAKRRGKFYPTATGLALAG